MNAPTEYRARRNWRISLLRLWLHCTMALLALLVAGAAYQHSMSTRDRDALPPPGRLVEVGGKVLHLHCTGSGDPTVVLEAGNLAYSATWAWVQEPLARVTRVCSYDRAGLAWSEATDAPATAVRSPASYTDSFGGPVKRAHSCWWAIPWARSTSATSRWYTLRKPRRSCSWTLPTRSSSSAGRRHSGPSRIGEGG